MVKKKCSKNVNRKILKIVGMKLWMICILLLLSNSVELINLMKMNITFLPNLPVGLYKIHINRILSCNPEKKNKLQFNWFLFRTSSTSAELKGNITSNGITFDDNLTYKVSIDTKNTFGRWSKNSILLTKEKACSTMQSFIKEEFLTNIGWDGVCPILPGVYVTTGFPATNVETALSGLPKLLPYGSYKFFLTVVDKNNEYIGCVQHILDVKRPWDMP